MGVRFTIIAVCVFVLCIGFTLALQCSATSNFDSMVCGSRPDSVLGYGAVDICDECHPCGVADGVCPEDFSDASIGRGSCRFCPDPDCLVSIDGHVENTDGMTVPGATIVALYDPDIRENVATTDASGYYTGSVRTGYIKLFVDYEDFDSRIRYVDIQRENNGIVKTVDFTGSNAIEPGTCSASCTDTFGTRCKASCDGINGCGFENFTVATLCDDKIVGSKVFLDDDNYIVCCEGDTTYSANSVRINSKVGLSDSSIDNLVTFVQRSRAAGEQVDIHVAVWNAND